MKTFEIGNQETLEKVLDVVGRNEDYRRADSDVKAAFLKGIHEQIIHTAFQKALDELYPPPERRKTRKQGAKKEAEQ
jgi:hypothetical protein